MIPAFGMVILPQNPSTGDGHVPGWSCILSVGMSVFARRVCAIMAPSLVFPLRSITGSRAIVGVGLHNLRFYVHNSFLLVRVSRRGAAHSSEISAAESRHRPVIQAVTVSRTSARDTWAVGAWSRARRAHRRGPRRSWSPPTEHLRVPMRFLSAIRGRADEQALPVRRGGAQHPRLRPRRVQLPLLASAPSRCLVYFHGWIAMPQRRPSYTRVYG